MGDAEEGDIEAIMEAAERGDLEEVRRLVEQDRQLLDAVLEGSNDSPLTAAAREGHLEVVRYLLDEGADINLRPGGYSSALSGACSHSQVHVITFLLERGADTGPLDAALLVASYFGRAWCWRCCWGRGRTQALWVARCYLGQLRKDTWSAWRC
jgi:ankyrin repeat protein